MHLLRPDVAADREPGSVPDPARRPPARTGLRLWLLLLAAMLTLPLFCLAIGALLREHESARLQSEDQLVMQARALASSADSQLATAAAVARTLAHSGLLARGDLVGFRAEMDAAAAGLPGAGIALADCHAQLLATTFLPPGQALPPGTPAPAAAGALAAGRDTISDLFIGPFRPNAVLAATALVPVKAGAPETDPGAVSVVLQADFFTAMLQAQARAPGWVAVLADRQFRTAGRSQDLERFAYHRRIPLSVQAGLQQDDAGITRFDRPDGVAAVAAFARAPASGYVAVIGLPAAVFGGALRGAVLQVLAVAVPVTLLGFGLALWLSSRITRAMDALALPAAEVPDGLRFREVDRIAERLSAAERWRLVLIEEMNHRVKNTLMTVQAVASQTLRNARGDPELFRQAFMARLATLGRAHDVLTATAGHGASIETTLKAGLAPWLEAGGHALRLRVAQDFEIGARQAQALILALHELGTNAAKYGALSRPGGSVALACASGPDGFAVLRWQEFGGPALAGRPTRHGFGSRLLETVLPQDLGPGATVQRDFDPVGLRACIRFRPQAPAIPIPAEGDAGRAASRTANLARPDEGNCAGRQRREVNGGHSA